VMSRRHRIQSERGHEHSNAADVDLQAGDDCRLGPGDAEEVAASAAAGLVLTDGDEEPIGDEAEYHGGEVRSAQAELADDVRSGERSGVNDGADDAPLKRAER
jgi:hypothetical protein